MIKLKLTDDLTIDLPVIQENHRMSTSEAPSASASLAEFPSRTVWFAPPPGAETMVVILDDQDAWYE